MLTGIEDFGMGVVDHSPKIKPFDVATLMRFSETGEDVILMGVDIATRHSFLIGLAVNRLDAANLQLVFNMPGYPQREVTVNLFNTQDTVFQPFEDVFLYVQIESRTNLFTPN